MKAAAPVRREEATWRRSKGPGANWQWAGQGPGLRLHGAQGVSLGGFGTESPGPGLEFGLVLGRAAEAKMVSLMSNRFATAIATATAAAAASAACGDDGDDDANGDGG